MNPNPMLKVFIYLFILISASLLLKFLSIKFFSRSTKSFDVYKIKDYLLTKAENNFYQTLLSIFKGTKYFVHYKIRLADIFDIKGANKGYLSALNKITSKHVDFVICDNTARIIIAIELDDSSHNSEKAHQKDTFKNEIFIKNKVPLLRFKMHSEYNPDDILKIFNEAGFDPYVE
jgi:hypothetical protein